MLKNKLIPPHCHTSIPKFYADTYSQIRKTWRHGRLAKEVINFTIQPSTYFKESICQCRKLEFDPRVGKIPWRRKWQPIPVFLPGKSHRQKNLAVSWGRKRVRHNLATKQQQHTHVNTTCITLCLVAQVCPTLCDTMDCSPPGSSVHGDSPGRNTGVGCHVLLQGIFPTQGSNSDLPHCRRILFQLSHKGSPCDNNHL